MTSILVTGGTGTLGTPTVAALRAAGHDVRVLSRRTGEGLATGDLLSGDGIADALAGVHTVLHLATGRKDVDASRTLLTHGLAAGIRHLVFMSIVGVDRIPLGYYRNKVVIEKLVAESGVPYTILRATQFHNLVAGLFAAQRFSPVVFAPSVLFQPIDVSEVAARLVELAETDAAGRVPDIGGPEQRTARSLAAAWSHASGSRRPVCPLWLPGKIFAALRAGDNLVPGAPYGRLTFEGFLAHASRRDTSSG